MKLSCLTLIPLHEELALKQLNLKDDEPQICTKFSTFPNQ